MKLLPSQAFIYIWMLLRSLKIAKADPNNYPVHFNFSNFEFDPTNNSYTQENISKNRSKIIILIALSLNNLKAHNEGAEFVTTNFHNRITFSGSIENHDTPTYEYSINMWVFTYRRDLDAVCSEIINKIYRFYSDFLFKGYFRINSTVEETEVTCWAMVDTTNSRTTRTFIFSWYKDQYNKFAYGLTETDNRVYSWQ